MSCRSPAIPKRRPCSRGGPPGSRTGRTTDPTRIHLELDPAKTLLHLFLLYTSRFVLEDLYTGWMKVQNSFFSGSGGHELVGHKKTDRFTSKISGAQNLTSNISTFNFIQIRFIPWIIWISDSYSYIHDLIRAFFLKFQFFSKALHEI